MPLADSHVGEPVHVSTCAPAGRPRVRGIRGHELDARVTTVVDHEGVRLTDPATTWCLLAQELPFPELVALGDYLVTSRSGSAPLCARDELTRAVSRRAGQRGAGVMRDALALIREGAQSREDSLVRVMLHHSGFPEPALNVRVGGAHEDAALTIPLAYVSERISVEIVREAERSRSRLAQKLSHSRQLERLGWVIVQVSDADLHHSRTAVLRDIMSRLRQLLASRASLTPQKVKQSA